MYSWRYWSYLKFSIVIIIVKGNPFGFPFFIV